MSIPIPDLLHLEPRQGLDTRQLEELLGLGFTGRETELALERVMAESHEPSSWDFELFGRDLFVRELVRDHFKVRIDEREYAPNQAFLVRVLTRPPSDPTEIRFRQDIVRELDTDPALRRAVEGLYSKLYDLKNLFKVPGRQARLDLAAFRIDLFKLAREILDHLANDFADASSGLRRLSEVGREIQQGSEYQLLAAILDHVGANSTLNVDLAIGADGRITGLRVREVRENNGNPFYRTPWRRWIEKFRFMVWYGYRLKDHQIVGRLVDKVFDQLQPALQGLLQLLGHLEVYLANEGFRHAAESRGLAVGLADCDGAAPRALEALFNPLLLSHELPPVPCTVGPTEHRGVTLLTGPNSGGKTRFLQALGLAQLLGQSGLYLPAARANLVPLRGMVVSLIENEAVEHSEGRLGRELERIRAMFDALETPSLVILDELCSGTNPSEATEVFSMVLELLAPLDAQTYISTHFLDFAHQLEAEPPVEPLAFLQVAMGDDQRSTYQFVPGVADTSMATTLAERMGVTFDELSQALARRQGS